MSDTEKIKIVYERNPEELFLSQATTDLKKGLTTYVYKEDILEKLKDIFSNLDIRKSEFYWAVRNKEVSE